jgi:flagellin
MAEVTLSSAVRNNLLSLQSTADLLSSTQERLATGLQVNSALDDPNAFFTASSLNARGNDLNRLLDSVGLSVQTLKAADEGIKALTTLVETAQATARQALQATAATSTVAAATVTGTGVTVAADAVASTGGTAVVSTNLLNVGGLVADADSVSFSVNGQAVSVGFTAAGGATTGASLDITAATVGDLITEINVQLDNGGTAGANGVASIVGGNFQLDGADATVGQDITAVGGTNTAAALGITATNAVNLVSQGISGTLSATIGSGATTTVTVGAGNVETLAALNSALGGLAGGTASVASGGGLTVTAGNTTDSVTLGGTALASFGTNLNTTPITPVTTVTAASTERTNLESEYNSLLTQINQIASDASFNGNNLLQGGNLSVIFNEDGSSSLSVTGVTFSATGLGITSPAGNGFQEDAVINSTLTELDTAIGTLRSQSSTFGSNLSVVEVRQDFTKGLINTLETGAGNLTLADTNLEGANLLALQTRQQLSSVALSLASQADQNVLRLIR